MLSRRHITKPTGAGGLGALRCMPMTSKPWAIGFPAATYAVHAWANAASVWPKGPTGERTG
jgi:hypothetical protein